MLKRSNKRKMQYRSKSIIAYVIVISSIAFILFHFSNKNHIIKTELTFNSNSQSNNPTSEIVNGTHLIWKIPNSPPKAVLFIAHGCHRKALDFWDKSSHCPECTGLPEDRLLVRYALSRNFAVITISSSGTCWTFGKEKSIVRKLITSWLKTHELDKLPLVALGASSGGYFVSALAVEIRFSSIVLMIAEGVFDKISITKEYPPTLFVHMPKDVFRQRKIREFLEGLRMEGVDTAEIECFELPLSTSFLSDRVAGVERDVSGKIFEVFKEKGFVDEKGYMKRDGRRTPWKEAISREKIMLDESLVIPVEEELNLAFAYHEMTSLQSEEIFNWFESHMS